VLSLFTFSFSKSKNVEPTQNQKHIVPAHALGSLAARSTDGLSVRQQGQLMLKRLGLMVALLALIHGTYTWYLLQDLRYVEQITGGEVVLAIARSLKKAESNVAKLLLGDSVGKQLYPMEKNVDTVQSLACNQAISLAGQYFLLQNFLTNNPPNKDKPYKVYFVVHPQSLINNLDELFTYHNFVKNFYTEPYTKEFTPEVDASLAIIPYKWIARNPLIMTTNYAPMVHFDHKHQRPPLSPITRAYLPKIVQLCKEKGVQFQLIPPFIAEGKKYRVDNLKAALEQHPDMKPYFTGYFEKIKYLPTSAFVDSIHLHNPQYGRDALGVINN
jgi:hypothetical protein